MVRFVSLVLLMYVSVGAARAAEVKVVVKHDGKPVPKAKVTLYKYVYDNDGLRLEAVMTQTTDDEAKTTLRFDEKDSFQVIAEAPGLIGSTAQMDQRANDPIVKEAVVSLSKIISHTGRFLDDQGKPLAGVQLRVASFASKTKNMEGRTEQYFSFPESLVKPMITDERGAFSIPIMPEGFQVYLKFTSKSHGNGTVLVPTDKPSEITLQKPAFIRATFDYTEDSKQRGDKVLAMSNSLRGEYLPNVPVADYNIGKPNADGTWGPIVPGTYTTDFAIDPKLKRRHVELKPIELKPGAMVDVSVTSKLTATITGKLVEKGTGKGLKGVSVSAYSESPREYSLSSETDADGRYEITINGDNTYSLSFDADIVASERHFLRPAWDSNTRAYTPPAAVKSGATHEFPTIELEEALTFRGRVVDAEGKPITGKAEMFAPTSHLTMYKTESKIESDFKINGLEHDLPFTIRIRQGKAVNVPEPLDAKKLNELTTFTISEKNAVKVVGKIEQAPGVGISGVKVELQWMFSFPGKDRGYSHRTFATTTTDDKGQYIFDSVWPGERYYISAEDDRFGKVGGDFNATKMTGAPGSTTTMDTFQVKPLTTATVGTLVHLDGSPVVGVTVTTCGETPKPITAKTDANGKFTLTGLPTGSVFLTVAHEGYRPTYVVHNTADKQVKITLRKRSDAPEALPELPKNTLEERKQATVAMYEAAWAKREDHGYGMSIFADALLYDPSLAQRWADAATRAEAEQLKKAIARVKQPVDYVAAALEDVDEAIDQIVSASSAPAYTLMATGEKLLAKDKAKALRFAEEATIRARKENATNPGRKANALAGCASLAHRAGNVAGAKKLFDEAIELLKPLDKKNLRDPATSWVAEQLAKVDLPAALKLLDDIKEEPYYKESALVRIIVNIAATNPKLAVEMVNKIKIPSDTSMHLEKARVAVVIAEREPELAIQLIEQTAGTPGQVQGWIELAKIVAKKDPKQAWAMTEKALALVEKDTDAFGTFSNYGGPPIAALQVAVVAKEIKHPDAFEFVARALALRQVTVVFSRPSEDFSRIAFALVQLDVNAARSLYNYYLPEVKQTNIAAIGRREKLFTLALVNPAQCQKVVLATLANTQTSSTLSNTGIVELLDGLAKPGQEYEGMMRWESLIFRPLNRE